MPIKFKRIQNRPVRVMAFLLVSPFLIWSCIDFYFDTDEFFGYIKEMWRQ